VLVLLDDDSEGDVVDGGAAIVGNAVAGFAFATISNELIIFCPIGK
jgi:hypothetical protein